MANWTTSDMPTQAGRSAVVTGADGIGFECALALARVGADVVVASRNPERGAASVERIRAQAPGAKVIFESVDLASLRSVRAFATRLKDQRAKLDLLINNAGVMCPPRRLETEDGFELQLGTNYLGHFALTGALLPLLQKGNAPRVVTLSSIAARNGAISFDDFQARRTYLPMPVYAQSKLACLMFALELQRRSEANHWGISSFAAHPGLSRTQLLLNAPGAEGRIPLLFRLFRLSFQSPADGALPVLFAATSGEAKPGAYYGPDKISETRGHPALSRVPKRARDDAAAARLWQVSEQLTSAAFPAARTAQETAS